MRKFMRTRAPPGGAEEPEGRPLAPPSHPPDALAKLNGHAHKTNGHANGVSAHRDEHHSTLSRYWSGSESSAPLFEDAAFPADWRALGERRLAQAVRWCRPHELCARPRFRGDSSGDGGAGHGGDGGHEEPPDELAARWTVSVGELGDAHLCCAAAALALTPRLLDRVAPRQSFRQPYCGAFRFRFWVFGSWREVVVDDRLPTRGARLLGSRGAALHDFTLPLLEKAYAKLHGGYAALRGGSVARALQDLAGGVVQSFSLRAQPRPLTFQVLNSAVPRSTLLVASAAPAARPPGGLLPGQAYCVTGLARVRLAGEAAGPGDAGALVRLRAPSGRGVWAGAWAPASAEWRALAAPDRDLLAPRADRPGDFWMSFIDFARSFSQLELVHVGPDDWLMEPALHGRRPWRAVLARRRWRRGYNAGGPPSCTETTGTNPQFHVQIPRSETAGARKCHVVVSVTQEYSAGGAGGAGKLRAIGFAVYELGGAGALCPLDVTHSSRAREVVTFFTLPPGRYLLVPHTRRPHTEAGFLLRILTDEQTDVWEVNEDNVIVRDVAAEFLEDAQSIPLDEYQLECLRHPPGGAGGGGGGGGGGRGSGLAGRRGAAARAAARVARRAAGAAVAGAVPRARGAARRGAGGRHARARAAGAAGAAGLLAPRLPARGGRAPLRGAPRVVLPPARAAVGGRRHGLQQGAGVPGAALRAPRRLLRGGLRHGAGPAAPGARAIPQSGYEDEDQPSLPGRDDPDDDLLVRALRPLPPAKYICVYLL